MKRFWVIATFLVLANAFVLAASVPPKKPNVVIPCQPCPFKDPRWCAALWIC